MPTDDRTLLCKTHAGHEPYARELWHRHGGWMLAYARTLLGNRYSLSPEDEDVVQSVFCRLLALDSRTLRSVRQVQPWLARLVRHEALNQIRTTRRAAQREARAHRPSRAVELPHHTHDLARAMSLLPRRLREVAYLRHIAGLTTDQTALVLDIPRGTVASRRRAAVCALRDRLDPADPANPSTPTPPKPVGARCHVLAD